MSDVSLALMRPGVTHQTFGKRHSWGSVHFLWMTKGGLAPLHGIGLE